MSREHLPPLHRRISFRIALGSSLGFLILSWLSLPVWDLIWPYFHPDVPAPLDWDEGWTLGEIIAGSAIHATCGLLLGGVLGHLFTRRALTPLRDIAQQAAEPFGHDDPLPGPFEVTGDDEVAQLATALNAMRARGIDLRETLAGRDGQRREWIAQISHDLRTPLTALVTCLDLLELRMKKSEDEHGGELIVAARHDADRVMQMAEDLLRIARLELDEELTLERVQPAELIEATVTGLAPLAGERGLELEVEVAGDLPAIEADGLMVLRGLENLVSNSLRHAESRIRLEARVEGQSVRFTVLDDGPGLPTNGRPVRFADLRAARSGADSSGLGLLVTERVAGAHGGRTGCANRPEGGAEVWFEVPVGT